jgi:enoyl-CoA hydratase/carnithine racemase
VPETPTILLDRPGTDVAVLRINRPEVRNALDTASLDLLNAHLKTLAQDPDLRALVISTTSTVALCAGADVGEPLDHAGGVRRMTAFARMYELIDAFPVVTIAVAVGNCVGGGAELVAGVDLRVAGDNLKLAWAGGRLGVPVGPARLAPLVGLAAAKDLVLTGRPVGPDEAARLGLAQRVAPAGEAESVALELAAAVAEQSPAGIRVLKQMFRDLEGMPARIAHENDLLLQFQHEGQGLPKG